MLMQETILLPKISPDAIKAARSSVVKGRSLYMQSGPFKAGLLRNPSSRPGVAALCSADSSPFTTFQAQPPVKPRTKAILLKPFKDRFVAYLFHFENKHANGQLPCILKKSQFSLLLTSVIQSMQTLSIRLCNPS